MSQEVLTACRRAEVMMALAVAAPLAEEERVWLDAHLAGCSACSVTMALLASDEAIEPALLATRQPEVDAGRAMAPAVVAPVDPAAVAIEAAHDRTRKEQATIEPSAADPSSRVPVVVAVAVLGAAAAAAAIFLIRQDTDAPRHAADELVVATRVADGRDAGSAPVPPGNGARLPPPGPVAVVPGAARPEAVGLWMAESTQVAGLAFDLGGDAGTMPAPPASFLYDGASITLPLVDLAATRWAAPDGHYTVAHRWRGDALDYWSPVDGWRHLASFAEGRFEVHGVHAGRAFVWPMRRARGGDVVRQKRRVDGEIVAHAPPEHTLFRSRWQPLATGGKQALLSLLDHATAHGLELQLVDDSAGPGGEPTLLVRARSFAPAHALLRARVEAPPLDVRLLPRADRHIQVEAALAEVSGSPACGVLAITATARYRVVRVLAGAYDHRDVYVHVLCPELLEHGIGDTVTLDLRQVGFDREERAAMVIDDHVDRSTPRYWRVDGVDQTSR